MRVLIGTIVAVVVFFTLVNYMLIDGGHLEIIPDNPDSKLLDSFCFTMATWSTTGCSNVAPVTGLGKCVVSAQYVIILAIAIGFLRVTILNRGGDQSDED